MVKPRRRWGKLSKEEFERLLQVYDQQDAEQNRNRQHRSNKAPVEESNDVSKISHHAKSKGENCDKEATDSTYSPAGRSKESPKSSKTTTRPFLSSRHDDHIGARSKDQRRVRTELSSGDDNDDGPTAQKIYKCNKLLSPVSKSENAGTPSKKKYDYDEYPRDNSTPKERCDYDGNSRKYSTPDRKFKSNKGSSPFYKRADEGPSSAAQWKKERSIRQERVTKNKNECISLPRKFCAASPSSITSPIKSKNTGGGRKNYRLDIAADSDGTRTNIVEKVSSSSQSTTMPPEEPPPIDAGNSNESDSDASWDLLALKRKKEKTKNQEANKETKKIERSDHPHCNPMNNAKMRNFSMGEDEEGDLADGNERFRRRKEMPRKRRVMDDGEREHGDERKPKRARESTSLIIKKNSYSSDCDDDEEIDDDYYQTKPSIRHYKNRKPRSPATSKSDTEGGSISAIVEQNTKPAPNTFVDDDDDGFMSDCDPLPASSTGKLVKENNASRCRKDNSSEDDTKRSRKKERRDRGQYERDHFADSHFDKDRGGSLDDLHPNFENPKFGPYEPMEPLVLSNSQEESPVQVPASLNRYIAPFQKKGIQFMYDCLARNSGVILGDEMGCGKTVQVISLLCALFKKTGTRKDFTDIRDRNVLVRQKVSKVQRLKDQALHMGEVFNDDIEEWKTSSLSLSPWNPVMIIVPPTIMDTWKNAFETFSHFSVSFYSGKTRVNAINSLLHGSADILIVPKSAFQDKRHLSEFEKVKWKVIIIDEFHNFKNHKAKISIHLRKLKELHKPLVLGMTGTPMQNNHTELWNLVDLVETNYFGTKDEFKEEIERPITNGRQKSADPRAKARSEAASAELRKGLNKIYIKRSKKDVLKGQLPGKSEEFILCDLSPLQKEVYRHVIQLPDFDLVKHGSRPCDCGINQNFFRKLLKLKGKAEKVEFMRRNKSTIENQASCCKSIPINPRYGQEGEPKIDQDAAIWRTLDAHCTDAEAAEGGCERCPWCCVLPCLTKLNKLSSHLGLLQAKKTTESIGSPAYIRYMKEREFAKVALAGIVDQLPGRDYDRNDGIMDDHFNLSGKLRVLNNLLQKDYDEGGKVLLFSHSTQSLDLIENWLRSRGSFEYSRMDGKTPLSRRQHLTDEFNNTDHIFLFLLSIKATGLGLNLTSANRVIMFDVSWNPSWEIQAQDRAHRIGQTRDVHVVRLISKGTLEEMIYLRQIYKEHLKQDTLEEVDDGVAPRVFRGVQGDKYRKGELFGTENLFRFKDDGSFLQDIYDMRPESRKRGKGDSAGLEIHDSTKVSELLLGMTDEEKRKVVEGDDLAVVKSLSGDSICNIAEQSPRSIEQQEARSADEKEATDDSREKKFQARNHRDLFRSDRGGAAINPGEEGFDEEMGGQTQAAFEIYENIKDNICGEEEGSNADDDDDEDRNDDKHDGKQTSEINHDHPILKFEPEIVKSEATPMEPETVKSEATPMEPETVKSETTSLSNPTVSSGQTIAQTISTAPLAVPSSTTVNINDEGSNLSHDRSNSKHFSRLNLDSKLDFGSITSAYENRRSEIVDSQIASPKNSFANVSSRENNQNTQKILLMGRNNIDNTKTEFSAADLRRPEYGKKKKKKKKKKKSNEAK